MRKLFTTTLIGVSLVGAVAVGAPAFADPSTFQPLNGVGSDTTDPVMDALAGAINGGTTIGNYNALPAGNITTGADPSCTIARPNGSKAGRLALDAAVTAGKNCLQFARSSAGVPSPLDVTNKLTWVPYAIDGVTFAARSDGTAPKSLTSAQLISIYTCGVASIHPVLPQPNSGTRSFWLKQMNITEAQITAGTYPCLQGLGTVASPAYVEEHDGRALATNQIMPFSIAQWDAQATATIPDIRGKTIIGNVDAKTPSVLNAGGAFTREVYNIVPTAKITGAAADPLTVSTFATGSSSICTNSAIITQYGFAVDPACGATTLTAN